MTEPLEQFREAIRAAGLTPPGAIEADGKLHRFQSNGKAGDDAGWYVLHLNGTPAGIFGDWRSGVSEKWKAKGGRKLTPSEAAQQRAAIEAMRRERDAEERRGHEVAATEAAEIWKAAQPAPEDHGYLRRKGVGPHGARVGSDGRLLVPMRDASGKLWNLERIAQEKPADGGTDKKGLYRGKRTGCYCPIGNPEGAAALCIAEGFATGASIFETTGYPVAVAFNAGNVAPVATALRRKFPDLSLVICADDDYRTKGNPGLAKATEAARAVDGLLAVPDFGQNRPEGATDFNDLHLQRGAEAVRVCIQAVLDMPSPNGGVTGVTGVQPNAGADSGVTPDPDGEVTGVAGSAADSIPDTTERPAFRVFDEHMEHGGITYQPGVHYFDLNKENDPTSIWVCSPLYVVAVTRDAQDNNFGRLLRLRNSLGIWREWAMPMEMLGGDGSEMRRELLAMGVEIAPSTKARNLLATYLQINPPRRQMRCALQVGWIENSFVLPDVVIGRDAAQVTFQSGERGHEEYTRGGTLEGWKAEVSARAVGNPLLMLGLSASFAGPMLKRCNADGGGFHYVGDSSTGKTTVIEAACSTWGGENYRRSWRATANGMEGAAALFNDGLLALDEISECDPREVGSIVYALGNGRGKQRAGRSGSARAVARWRCIVLSSGERTIGTHMAEAGQRAKAGQSVRLLDVPASRLHGVWDELHGFPSGAALSEAIRRAAVLHHGRAGRAFLEKFTHDERDFPAMLERLKALPEFSADGSEGQERRAAARFALVALAGELATEYGITGWQEGDAIKAAAEVFRLWRSHRGRGNDERRQILEQVSHFIDRHGDSRFSDMNATDQDMIRDRAGWWRGGSEGRTYLFTTGGMRDALKGFDFGRALDVLEAAGALPTPGGDGKRAKPQRIRGRPVRVYEIDPDKLAADHGD